ncbi:MAG: hypothetical protein JW997_03170, partial [Actinobacteria bacterium]|nr:hypothetical protein [Actinomycetota bacterium]
TESYSLLLYDKILYMKMKNFVLHILIILVMLSLFFIAFSCGADTIGNSFYFDNHYPEKFAVLSQNAMLIPFLPVAPSYRQRALMLSELLYYSNFDIAGLQEIFWDRAQVMITTEGLLHENF